jgi:hypothetical protein
MLEYSTDVEGVGSRFRAKRLPLRWSSRFIVLPPSDHVPQCEHDES